VEIDPGSVRWTSHSTLSFDYQSLPKGSFLICYFLPVLARSSGVEDLSRIEAFEDGEEKVVRERAIDRTRSHLEKSWMQRR